MKTAFIIFVLAFSATSILARPPSFDSEEYTDNNLIDSIPVEDDLDDERADFVQM